MQPAREQLATAHPLDPAIPPRWLLRMNSLPRLCAALIALACVLPLAAFEGRVHFDMKSGRDSNEIAYAIKGDKARIEWPGKEIPPAIIDGTKQEMMMLMPEQKMYMRLSMADATRVAKKGAKNEVEFEDTGETEEILGRTCHKYRVSDRNGITHLWAAEGMGTFMGQLGGGKLRNGGDLPAWQRTLGEKGFFPLRVVGTNKRGKETFRMEATKIDETSLADTLFEVPAGYQKFDMGGMMRGLIPGAR